MLLWAPASHGRNPPFLVTDNGVGDIDSRTPCTPKAVSAGLGGLPVAATKVYYDDIAVPVLEATRDGKRVLLAYRRSGGDLVSHVIAYAPETTTSTGVEIGTAMAEVYAKLPNRRCRNGLEQQKGLVFCPAPYLGNVRFAFRCNYATRGDALPPADVLARCPLEFIIWLADD
jgi:hypothetical protein